MKRKETAELIFDNWHHPIVFCDTEHIIRYMNRAAVENFKKWGDLVGRSLLDCHNPASRERIKADLERLRSGEVEILHTDNEKKRLYTRGVYDEYGEIVGYFERYDPPRGS